MTEPKKGRVRGRIRLLFSREPDAGLSPRTPGSWPELRQSHNHLNHPDTWIGYLKNKISVFCNDHTFIFRKWSKTIKTDLDVFSLCFLLYSFGALFWDSVFSMILKGYFLWKCHFSGTGIDQDGKSHNYDNWSLSKIYKWLVSSQQIEIRNMPQLYLPREWLRKQ